MKNETISRHGYIRFLMETQKAYHDLVESAQIVLYGAKKAKEAFSKRKEWMDTGLGIGEFTYDRAVDIEVSASQGVARKEWALSSWQTPEKKVGPAETGSIVVDTLVVNVDIEESSAQEKRSRRDYINHGVENGLISALEANTLHFRPM